MARNRYGRPVVYGAAIERIVRAGPPLPASKIASRVGCSPGTARRHLDRLTMGRPRLDIYTAANWDRCGRAPNPRLRVLTATGTRHPPLLVRLSADPDRRVRRAVAANPHCPPRLLPRLHRDAEQS